MYLIFSLNTVNVYAAGVAGGIPVVFMRTGFKIFGNNRSDLFAQHIEQLQVDEIRFLHGKSYCGAYIEWIRIALTKIITFFVVMIEIFYRCRSRLAIDISIQDDAAKRHGNVVFRQA